MFSIRNKLVLGFVGILAMIAIIGTLTINQVDQLGNAINVILTQNYRSVAASQEMKEALEKMDSGILFSFAGHHETGQRNIRENETQFRKALKIELGNITIPGEKEKAERIAVLFEEYVTVLHQVIDDRIPLSKRTETYFSTLLPLLTEIKTLAQQVLDMNQAKMDEANNSARLLGVSAHNRILAAIAASAAFAVFFSFLSRRWILKPIRKLIDSTNEIRNGNLDLVLETETKDEIGQLSAAFNDMALTLRQVRNNDREKIQRTSRATQEVMNILPTPIAIFDTGGRVDVATRSAMRYFGLNPGVSAENTEYSWLPSMLERAVQNGTAVETENGSYIQKFIDNREFFFRPAVVPIPPFSSMEGVSGTVLVLHDMTQVHEQKELKRGVVSTVSHQLRTPLTSLRMSIHLLLEERIGHLNEKQNELLQTAREESERLADILDELLDLNRIEAGRARLDMQSVDPETLVRSCIEPFYNQAVENGIALVVEIPESLPQVLADRQSIQHVFSNLLSNAIRFTGSGGRIIVTAAAGLSGIRFSVHDTGEGIAPEHLKHLFDQFYRVPGQDDKSGIGLGLSIAKEIVTAHGGSVGVESTIGKGSVFHFTLPV
ncbi:MAG: HAMP domain-containing protein [Chlorobiaceae bacterium]|nr:HAMP domain-containing protein [Chlorobiaceae bacterium]